MNRLIAMLLAALLTISSAQLGWADGAEPESAQTSAPTKEEPDGGAVAAAVVSNLFYVPGKLGTCIVSGALWTVVMAVTGGVFYKEAGNLVHGACTGKWVLTGEDMMDVGKGY